MQNRGVSRPGTGDRPHRPVTAQPALKPLAVGVTGGIGSGKTLVMGVFESMGAKILLADPIARTVVERSDRIRERIRREFGPETVLADGTLDRKRLGKMIFFDPSLRSRLEAIVHPAVLEEISREIREFKELCTGPVIAVEAAILYEANASEMFDYVVVVDAPRDIRIDRIASRDRLSRQEILQRMESQAPPEEKADRADFVLRNTGTREELEEKARFLYRLLETLASSPG